MTRRTLRRNPRALAAGIAFVIVAVIAFAALIASFVSMNLTTGVQLSVTVELGQLIFGALGGIGLLVGGTAFAVSQLPRGDGGGGPVDPSSLPPPLTEDDFKGEARGPDDLLWQIYSRIIAVEKKLDGQ